MIDKEYPDLSHLNLAHSLTLKRNESYNNGLIQKLLEFLYDIYDLKRAFY